MFKFFWRLIRPASHAESLQGWLDFMPYGSGAIVALVAFIFGLPVLWTAVVILAIVAVWIGVGAFSLFRENEAYKNRPTPNIVFDGFAPKRDQPFGNWMLGLNENPNAEFVRLRFVNEPEQQAPEANVPDLHAYMEILSSDRMLLLSVSDGRWADNADRGSAPSRYTKSVPIPGTGESRILDVAMRRLGWEDCFGWDHNGHQITDPPMPPGRYVVCVELSGTGMENRLFEFSLINPGKDLFLELEEQLGVNHHSRRWAAKQLAPRTSDSQPQRTS